MSPINGHVIFSAKAPFRASVVLMGCILTACSTPRSNEPPAFPAAAVKLPVNWSVQSEEQAPIDRSEPPDLETAIAESNRLRAGGIHSPASHAHAAGLAVAAAKGGRRLTIEERARISMLIMTHALLGDDTESLAVGVDLFEPMARSPQVLPGEIELFVISSSRLGRPLPARLRAKVHPEIGRFLPAER